MRKGDWCQKRMLEKSELFALKWSLDHISLHENVLWFIHEAGWLTRPFRSFIRGRGSGGLPSVKSESKLVLNGWELWTNNWSILYWEVWNQIKSFPCLSQRQWIKATVSPILHPPLQLFAENRFTIFAISQCQHRSSPARAEDCSCQAS